MKILDHTNEHSASQMRDVFESLINKEVDVLAGYAITGRLVSYNGPLLHIYSKEDHRDWYIKADSVQVISERNKKSNISTVPFHEVNNYESMKSCVLEVMDSFYSIEEENTENMLMLLVGNKNEDGSWKMNLITTPRSSKSDFHTTEFVVKDNIINSIVIHE